MLADGPWLQFIEKFFECRLHLACGSNDRHDRRMHQHGSRSLPHCRVSTDTKRNTKRPSETRLGSIGHQAPALSQDNASRDLHHGPILVLSERCKKPSQNSRLSKPGGPSSVQLRCPFPKDSSCASFWDCFAFAFFVRMAPLIWQEQPLESPLRNVDDVVSTSKRVQGWHCRSPVHGWPLNRNQNLASEFQTH